MKTFGANTFAARSFACGTLRGIGSSATIVALVYLCDTQPAELNLRATAPPAELNLRATAPAAIRLALNL